MQLFREQDHPGTPSSLTPPLHGPLSPTLAIIPETLGWADMPSPETYGRSSHQRTGSGSGTNPSGRYLYSQYPSPVDSDSSRSRRGGETQVVNSNGRQYYTRTSVGNTTAVVSDDVETESMDYLPSFPVIQSALYPGLHFLLARDSARANRFVVDMRLDPQDSIPGGVLESFGGLWVTRERPVHVRIVSPGFPWVLDIHADEPLEGVERGVTCADVWRRLYLHLHEPIDDADWAHLSDMAAHDPTARRRHEYLVSIARHRIARGEIISLTRLDWLARKTFFVGLDRDEGYRLSAHRLLPGRERCTETWVAYFDELDGGLSPIDNGVV